MATENVRALHEQHLKEANGDLKIANANFSTQVQELIEDHDVDLGDIGLGDLFEVMVDQRVDRSSSVDIAEAMHAAGMPILTGQLLHPVFIKAYEYNLGSVLQLVQEVTSKRSTEKIPGITSHDNLELVPEGEPFEESGGLEKYADIKNNKYGKKISLTKEAVLFDQTGLILDRARKIGVKTGIHLQQFVIQKVCDYATVATGEGANKSLVINGTARTMYADTHASWDTYANDNLGNAVLSHNSLVAALALFAGLKDDTGDLVMVNPRFLIVPAALLVTAKELVGSDMQYDTANRAMNVFKNAFTIVSSPYIDLTSSTAWFVGDPTMQTRLQWVWKPRTESLGATSQIAFDSDIVSQFKCSYFAGIGSTDYRYVVKGNA